MNLIQVRFGDGIATITLDNDAKSNALSLEMIEELIEALYKAESERMRVVVIRNNQGSKVWCAGLRIDRLPEPQKDPVPYEYALEKVLRSIERFPGAVIGLIDGGVWGGGCELAFACDILIGTPRASFAITPARIGAPYNPNQVNRVLQRVGSNIAMELFFTAGMVYAQRAHELGILNHLKSGEEIERFTYSMARRITENAPLTIRLIKYQIRQLAEKTVDQVTKDEFNRKYIVKVFESHDFKEGKQAFMEKRKPKFKGE